MFGYGPTMKLQEWLTVNGKTQREFARDIGLSEPNLSRIINRLSKPSAETLYKISVETTGAVQVSDFMEAVDNA